MTPEHDADAVDSSAREASVYDAARPKYFAQAGERMCSLELVTVREALGLTRDALARDLGVSRESVTSWELGRRNIPYEIRGAIDRLETYTASIVEQLVGQLTLAADKPVLGVYARDDDMPAPPSDAPLTPTARWWRAVAYEVARQVPGLRITDALAEGPSCRSA